MITEVGDPVPRDSTVEDDPPYRIGNGDPICHTENSDPLCCTKNWRKAFCLNKNTYKYVVTDTDPAAFKLTRDL